RRWTNESANRLHLLCPSVSPRCRECSGKTRERKNSHRLCGSSCRSFHTLPYSAGGGLLRRGAAGGRRTSGRTFGAKGPHCGRGGFLNHVWISPHTSLDSKWRRRHVGRIWALRHHDPDISL